MELERLRVAEDTRKAVNLGMLDRRDRGGIGWVHLNQLKAELRQLGVQRIDTSIHLKNELAHRFYERHGFRPLSESRLACVL
jgi:ribosomal protein S18 acetylase RimI-like enzyme